MTDDPKIDKSDLRRTIREERRRGRRPIDESILKEKRLLLRGLLAEKDEVTFRASIRALGLQEGSSSWNSALEAWHNYRREHDRERCGRL